MRAVLYNAQQAYGEFMRLWQFVKPLLLTGGRFILEVKQANRTLEQNAKFHALCEDLGKSKQQWLGKPRNAAQWKVLLVSGHAVATGEGSDIVAGLEGEFINLRESTALMSVQRSSSLIEYSVMWCALNGVKLSAPETEHA